jgi:hypothetical protein
MRFEQLMRRDTGKITAEQAQVITEGGDK